MATGRRSDSWTDDPDVAAAEDAFLAAIELGCEPILVETLGGRLPGGGVSA